MGSTAMPIMAGGHAVPVVYPDTANSQSVTVGASSVQSAVIHATKDRVVRIVAQAACWFALSADPTAAADTAGSTYLPADAIEFIAVQAGHKIGVIQDAAGGQLSITPAKTVG